MVNVPEASLREVMAASVVADLELGSPSTLRFARGSHLLLALLIGCLHLHRYLEQRLVLI